MFRSRFFWKLYLAYVVLLLATTAAIGTWIEASARAESRRDAEELLRGRAELLRDLVQRRLDATAGAELQSQVTSLGIFSDTRLTVIDAEGRVLADSEQAPERMDNHLQRPEIQESLRRGEGFAIRPSDTLGESYLYFALPVHGPGAGSAPPLGFVRAAQSLDSLDERLARLRRIVLVAVLFAALLGVWGGALFARRVTRPVDEMTELAEAITRGDYGTSIGHRGPDEIGRLATALNGMGATLRARMETITGDRNKVLAILASMVEGVVAVDKNERVVHMNEVAGRLLRVAPETSVGRRIWELTRVVEVPRILEAARQAAAEMSSEVRLSRGTGRPIAGQDADQILELRASPLRDGSGALAGAVVVLHDVTELRRLEGVRRDFVANVSHELKTPLTAIRGLVETLLDDEKMPAGTRERFLQKIRDQSSRLSSLVSDLLTLARIESQQAPPEPRNLDVRGPARESAARFGPLATHKGLELSIDLPREAILVRGDDEALRTIVDNLLDNAFKYTPEGGRVWLRVAADGGPGDGRASEARIEVEDTGIGIEPLHQDRIFERFYRVDKARSRELGGTGLGLSIVKHLTLSMGGRISLSSAPGTGSTFRIHLPVAGDAG